MRCKEGQHEHAGRCCRACPKGTHKSDHCRESSETRCEPCGNGFYTDTSNYIDNCLPCRTCNSNHHLRVLKSCTAESNTVCECMQGYYCTQTSRDNIDHCEECEPVRHCPPGQGVSFPPNSMHDTVCEPCREGTFNNMTDYQSRCLSHTSCSDLDRHLKSRGTAERDAECGELITRCHWMIPAGLWAGLILTLIIVFVGVICLKRRRKRKAVITLVSSENIIPLTLPPDVIKHPTSPELHALTNNNKPCAEEDTDALECDGGFIDGFSEKCTALSILDSCVSYISEPYRSEPQEDDWPGL